MSKFNLNTENDGTVGKRAAISQFRDDVMDSMISWAATQVHEGNIARPWAVDALVPFVTAIGGQGKGAATKARALIDQEFENFFEHVETQKQAKVKSKAA